MGWQGVYFKVLGRWRSHYLQAIRGEGNRPWHLSRVSYSYGGIAQELSTLHRPSREPLRSCSHVLWYSSIGALPLSLWDGV